MTNRPPTLEELEQEVKKEVDSEADAEKAPAKNALGSVVKVIGRVTDRIKLWGLPKGIDLERYRFLKKM